MAGQQGSNGSSTSNKTERIDSFGNRSLWQLINGTGVLRPKELVKIELERNEKKIVDGVSFFKKPIVVAGEQIKDKKLSKSQRDLVLKISGFLGIEELQSYELFLSFLGNDYRGSQKSLQHIFGNERQTQALVFKIRDYYYTERLYLLQCFKVIINFWQDDMHAFKDEFQEFMNKVNVDDGTILEKIINQFKSCVELSLPSWQTNGVLMTERQAVVWAHQNLKEQCELLEILMIYLKDFEIDTNKAIQLMEMFKRHGFGRHQTYKHILEESAEPFIRRIGYLEMLILLESLDLETVFGCTQLGQFDDHFILKDENNFMRLDKVMTTLGTDPAHGPILLCWAGIRMIYPNATDTTLTRKMGNMALQLHVFDTLYDVLNTEPFNSKPSFVSSVAHYILYHLFVNIMTAFDENTLARRNRDIEVLRLILCQILKQEFAAEDFWQKGLDEGLGSVFQSSLLRFPLDLTSLIMFSTALASSNQESAERVFGIWKNLQYYTEYLDRNSSSDLTLTKDPSVWQLARNKIPYHGGSFKIDAGTCGQILANGGKSDDSPIIQWEVTYNGWQLLLCEIENLLQQISYGAGSVSPSQVARVTTSIELVCAMLNSFPQVLDQFEQITECLYQLIHRFATYNSPPLELISSCIQCITCVAKKFPSQVWHKMKQTGLLPYLTENVDNLAEVLSGQGLSAGSYGALLAGYECTQGRYPVTTAFLEFISIFIQPFFKEEREGELMAPILYFLREVFPVFQKWRYYNSVKREVIGQKCLEIFHRILNFLTSNKKKSNRPQLQEICVYSLLFTEAGRSLLELIATGADTIEMALAQQGSIVEHGTGAEMIHLVQLSFSVLNRLLLLKSPDLPLSPVESALSSQPAGRQTQHIVATISAYIYHTHNPKLPTLACLLLKRLALVSRMSILACLGGEAESIRDMYITRLQAITEDLQLKVVILQLLSVCVEAQPGLIEIFLNVQPAETTDLSSSSKKDLSLGKTSCLQTVLDLMEAKKQGDYLCPPDLLCACLDFIHSLWSGLRDTAMSVLRARDIFWLSVCAPLTRDLPALGDQSEEFEVLLPYQMKTIAFVLRILSEEIYTVTSSKLGAKLKKVISSISVNNRWKYWSAYLKDCLITEAEKASPDSTLESQAENPTLQLLVAWKHFIVTAAKLKVEELKLTDSLKEAIIVDLMEGLQALVSGDNSPLNIKMAQVASALLFTLVNLWTNALSNQTRMVKELESAVTQTLSSSKSLIPPIQIGLLGCITIILQHSRLNSSVTLGKDTMSTILPTTCTVLLQSTRQMPSPRDLQESKSAAGDTGSADVKLKLQIVTCCLLEELLLQCSRYETWLPVMQEHFTLPTLLASVQGFIKGRQGVQYVHTVFLLLLTVAKTEKGAEALAVSGLTQYTCLSMISLYQDGDFFSQMPGKLRASNDKEADESNVVSWHRVYCLCIDLFATVMAALKYSFLEDVLHFVGAHQDRMQQCLELSRISMCRNALHEAEKTCDFIHELSFYIREWRLHLPESLIKLQTSMIYMSQSFIAFLMRPRYLQHVIEQQNGQKSKTRSSLSPKQPRLQQQSSLEDIDKPSKQLINTQHRMLSILGRSLSSLRQFTPNLCEILHEQSVDYSEYEPFLALGFSAPAVDQDSLPSFGTLTSCVRDVCVRLLTKLDARSTSSPHRSPDPNTSQIIPKHLVLYVMENALYIIMSQATRYLRDPALPTSDKQLLKRELGTEMNYFLMELQRYLRRGAAPSSPNTTQRSLSPHTPSGGAVLGRSTSQSAFTASQDTEFFRFVHEFVTQVLK